MCIEKEARGSEIEKQCENEEKKKKGKQLKTE